MDREEETETKDEREMAAAVKSFQCFLPACQKDHGQGMRWREKTVVVWGVEKGG